MFENYEMTSYEFLNFKNKIQNIYLNEIENKLKLKEIKQKIINKLEYFKAEGFINYYEINKLNKKNLKIIFNLGNELYEINITRG